MENFVYMKITRYWVGYLAGLFIVLGGLVTPGRAASFLISEEMEDSAQSWLPADSVFTHFLARHNIPLTAHNELEL